MLLKLPCLCLPLKHNKQMHWWKNGFSIFYTGKSALPIKTLLCPTKSPMPLWKEAKSEGFQWGFDDFSLWPKKHRERAIKEVLFKVFSIAEESTQFSSLVTIQTTKDSIFFWIQFSRLTRMISRLQMLHVEVWSLNLICLIWRSDYCSVIGIHRVVAPFHASLDVLFHLLLLLDWRLHFTLTIGCGTLIMKLLFLHHHFLLVSWMYHENGQAVFGDFGRIGQLVLDAAVHKKRLGKVLARRRPNQTSTTTFHCHRCYYLLLPSTRIGGLGRVGVHSWLGSLMLPGSRRLVIWKTSTCRRTHSVFHVNSSWSIPGVAQMGVATAPASVEDVYRWDLIRLKGYTVGVAHDCLGGSLTRQHGHGTHVWKMVGGWMYHRNHFVFWFVFRQEPVFRGQRDDSPSLDQRPEHTGASFGASHSAQLWAQQRCCANARCSRACAKANLATLAFGVFPLVYLRVGKKRRFGLFMMTGYYDRQ